METASQGMVDAAPAQCVAQEQYRQSHRGRFFRRIGPNAHALLKSFSVLVLILE